MVNNRWKSLWSLFVTFLKIGGFTFGGGYAMIPLIQKEVVDIKGWISNSDVLDIIAIAESTPGPIAINSATFVGYRVCGVLGAVCSTLGVVMPSFIIIYALSYVITEFQQVQAVSFAFNGIRAGVLALIIKALISMYKQCPKHIFSYVVIAAAFISVAFLKVNVLLVILLCAISGLVVTLYSEKRAKR
ncbi:chromate transporter [Hathewaya proteolytica DSM 3090]|uniref:Chromate transporter n=1 Tax=Hathewaya proteolytica DSM 3090 TaxID=1121331 RepID=A0A1M6K460_9CLOT|nr:chromate transporter [Hathewaya proteolytica]SHJ53728.1 chromate transporter [Hathewaya proteolytica DSM 3090]